MTATETDETGTATSELDVSIEEGTGWSRTLRVRVPADRMEGIRAKERDELGGSVNLKGFRPGKVPDAVIEKRFGEVVDHRTERAAIEEMLPEALRSAELQPAGRPEVHDVRYSAGEELVFEARLEVVPTLELERVSGFQIDRPDTEVGDEEVREVLDRLREDHGVFHPVQRPPEEGDQVAVRITPLDESGEPEEDEEEGEPYRFVLGEGYAIPDVEEAILSLEPGERDDFRIAFPEDFSSDELAGRTRRIRVELLEVKARELPALDDRFAAEVGDFDSLEELESAVLEDLRRHREEEVEEEVRRSLLDAIIEANPFDVPAALVERYLDRAIDAPEEADPEKVQQARERVRPRAEQEVRRQLVVDHLMERGDYAVSDAELEERIREIAESRDDSPEEVRRRLSRQGRLEGVRQHIATEKMFDELKESSRMR